MEISEEQHQVILEFVFESKETLDSLELTLIRLEEVSDMEKIRDTMNLIFRPFHTLKGGAGFLQLESIGKITHTTENLLQIFRADPGKWKHEYIDILMQSSDLLRQLLDQVEIEYHDKGFEEEMADLIAVLEQKFGELNQKVPEQVEGKLGALPSVSGPPTLPLDEVLKKCALFLHSMVESNWKSFKSDRNYQETIDLIEELIKHYNQISAKKGTESGDLFYLPDSDKTEKPALDESLLEEKTESDSTEKVEERLKNFVTTTSEHLENIEGVMLVIDKIPDDVNTDEYLQSAMRSFHTIKGNAGFLNQNLIESISHIAENTITGIQDGKIKLDEHAASAIFQVVDTLRSAISSISKEEQVNQDELLEIEKKLSALTSEQDSHLLGNILVKMGKVASNDVSEAIKQQKAPLGDLLVKMGKASKDDINKALTEQQSSKKPTTSNLMSQASVAKMQDIRVSLEKLDHLFDLVGELIISESMISRHPAMLAMESDSIKGISSQLHRNMRNLQEIVTSIRMVPISALFRKMVRVVHDASKKLGKKVKLELVGEKTEVDKTLVELITDPLLHIVRNAMDHGIETSEQREKAGKEKEGKLTLEAKHVGNEVWVSVKDNGKGLDKQKILQTAKEKYLITDDAVFNSDSDIWKLIFEAGFSTAETVTDFSGRGVGMDVVRRNIEKLRGTVDIHSDKDKGSTFTIKVPLTLSIIDGLLVTVGNVNYALPTTSIRETLQPKQADIIKTMDGSEMLRIRKKILPVIRLHKLYEILPVHQELQDGMLLIIDHAHHVFALFVDSVRGQQQIVVKNLPESMADSPHLTGCTILGDGQVGLILDTSSMAKAVIRQKRAL